jgi:hypothetical protein
MSEQDIRDKIADEILAKFGALAPYRLVARFVRKGSS